MGTELGRPRRRPRRQLGLDAPAKAHLAQRIAGVVALSLQRNGRETDNAAGGKQGLLASTLRLAEQNVADMTAFLRRREAEAAAIMAIQEQRAKEATPCCSEGEEPNVCVICLEGSVVAGGTHGRTRGRKLCPVVTCSTLDALPSGCSIDGCVLWTDGQWTEAQPEVSKSICTVFELPVRVPPSSPLALRTCHRYYHGRVLPRKSRYRPLSSGLAPAITLVSPATLSSGVTSPCGRSCA